MGSNTPPENQRCAVGIIGGGDIPVLKIKQSNAKGRDCSLPSFIIPPRRNYPCLLRRGGTRNPRANPQTLCRGDSVIGVADCLVIFPAAYITYVFFHFYIPFLLLKCTYQSTSEGAVYTLAASSWFSI